MSRAERRCFSCGAPATFDPAPALDVCATCARRVADLAMTAPVGVWADDPPRAPSAAATAASSDPVDLDEVFEAFKAGIAKQIDESDAASHLDLARAYLEMLLYSDARREAAIAVNAHAKPSATDAALKLLLNAPLLAPKGVPLLRARMRIGPN